MGETDAEQGSRRFSKRPNANYRKGIRGGADDLNRRAAGVTHAMLHYCSGQEQLVRTYPRREDAVDGESVLAAFGQAGPLARAAAIERHFHFIMANPDMPRFIVVTKSFRGRNAKRCRRASVSPQAS